MSKTLLIGPAGCGKTHTLLNSFGEALSSAADPLADDLFFVVPSAEHTERVVSLLVQRGLKGFFHKRVTTLSRLAGDIFRVADIPVASSLTRTMIVRDLIRENAWDYFSEVHEQPGFLGLMAQFITELKESCIVPEVFRERMNALKGFEPAYGAKHEALADFYEQYEARMKMQGLRDSQDALRIFRERKKKTEAPAPRFKAIWIDGFFDFSNLQFEYLRELSAITEQITITLTKEDGGEREDAFEVVNRTQRDLEKLGFKGQPMKPRSYRTEKPSLLFLQTNIFKGTATAMSFPHVVSGNPEHRSPTCSGRAFGDDKNKKSAPPQDIVMLDAIGTEGEIELIARQIHKLYASGDYRYSDFAVLFRQIRHYAPVIASVFSRYGIPAEIHERERLKFSSWIAAAASLLSIFRNDWQREDVFDFLKSGYVRRLGKDETKDEEWLAEFEQRSFAEGVAGTREAWLGDWKRGEAETLAAFNQKKAETLKALADLEDRFLAAKTSEDHIHAFKHAVYDTFGILEISDRYTSFTRRDAACVKRFEALLEEVQSYFLKASIKKSVCHPRATASGGVPSEGGKSGDLGSGFPTCQKQAFGNDGSSEISFENFADHFLGLVELDVYSLHERDKNRVQVYDVSLARQKEYRVVFVAGLLEKVFPMQVREDPLLSDWERKLMNGGMEYPLAECLPRQDIERFFFYVAVTRAKERLFLSCPHLDFEGKESLPSFYLEEVKDLFQGQIPVIRQDLARPFPAIEEAITRRELEAAVVGALRDEGSLKAELGKALAQLSGDPESRERLFSAWKPVEAKILDEKILKGGYFEIQETSPTRLETYAKCPFRYFSDKVLKLKEVGGDIRAMQKGSILHHVLEEFFAPQKKKDLKETPGNRTKDRKGFVIPAKAGIQSGSPTCSGRAFGDDMTNTEKLSRDHLEEFIEWEIEEGLKKHPMIWTEPYEEALDRRELFEMLLDFLSYETERLKGSSFKPCHVEYSFGDSGKNDNPALEIECEERSNNHCHCEEPRRGDVAISCHKNEIASLAPCFRKEARGRNDITAKGKAIKLRGRVDRIDTDAGKKFAVVMDYKRSAKFKSGNLELGTALQLPLYLLAAQKHLGLTPLGAEIYSIRDHKRSGFYCEEIAQVFEKEFSSRSCLPGEVFQKTLDRALVFVRKFTKEIASSAIPVRPRDCESFCPYDTVCRIEKWKLPIILEEIKAEDRKKEEKKLKAVLGT